MSKTCLSIIFSVQENSNHNIFFFLHGQLATQINNQTLIISSTHFFFVFCNVTVSQTNKQASKQTNKKPSYCKHFQDGQKIMCEYQVKAASRKAEQHCNSISYDKIIYQHIILWIKAAISITSGDHLINTNLFFASLHCLNLPV